jgi:acetolactate synthase I/II/III large subunit
MNAAESIIKILEEKNIKTIFGHPGEQIIPFYAAMKDSTINHVLMRHEQGAIHAADAYARTSGKFGVCVSTAGPGALNMVMGVAVAFKDSIPLLVITGDNPISSGDKDRFQDVDITNIFKPIVSKTFNPTNGKLAVSSIKEAIKILKNAPNGPIHINLPKNVLTDENIGNIDDINHKISDLNHKYSIQYNYSQLHNFITEIRKSKRPLIIAGGGVFWADATEDLINFSKVNKIPIVHTYHTKGLMKNSTSDLGLVGLRGSKMANFAFKNADLIIVLGSKLSERTTAVDEGLKAYNNTVFNYKDQTGKKFNKTKYINVNIDENFLSGDIKIHGNNKEVLHKLNSLNKITDSLDKFWWANIYKNNERLNIEGLTDENIPLKPQVAIESILNHFNDNIIVNDAGSHTTWVNLISEIYSNEKIIFSGGMGPMGYGLPAACGVAIARPNETVVLINGDGGFQMNVQELATIASNNLPILIFVLNNFQLGIIRQWEKLYYGDLRYSVDLENPDFVALANAYGIDGESVSSKKGLELALADLKLDKPYLIEILINEEDVPISNSFSKNML